MNVYKYLFKVGVETKRMQGKQMTPISRNKFISWKKKLYSILMVGELIVLSKVPMLHV